MLSRIDDETTKRRERAEARQAAWRDEIEINSADSFPASDPPSWTPVTRTGASLDEPHVPSRREASGS